MKRTKIIATISDLKCDVDFLKSLYDAGANIFRLNTAHQTPEDTLQVVKNIRAVSPKTPIMIDTKGPEVRTTPLLNDPIPLKRGEKVKFIGNKEKETCRDAIYLNYDRFHREVPKGAEILYDDGEMAFKVIEKHSDYLLCQTLNAGFIKGKKSINVPDVSLNLPPVTKKDKEFIEFSIKNNIDFIAHSFIRNKRDLKAVQKMLDKANSKVKLISKIENKEGVDNIEEILDHSAGVMVARGDLAIEIPLEKVPATQKNIINRCIERRKIVITATQMLHTMIDNPRPTRAEVSDIANAVYDGTDCVMLSGETAYGKYPLEAVKIMARVAVEAEENSHPYKKLAIESFSGEIPVFMAKSAIRASLKLPVKAIIAETLTGRTARYLSSFRGKVPNYALCTSERVMRELAFSYGVYAESGRKKVKGGLVKNKLRSLVRSKVLKETDLIVVLSGNFGATLGASNIEVATVRDILNKKKF